MAAVTLNFAKARVVCGIQVDFSCVNNRVRISRQIVYQETTSLALRYINDRYASRLLQREVHVCFVEVRASIYPLSSALIVNIDTIDCPRGSKLYSGRIVNEICCNL